MVWWIVICLCSCYNPSLLAKAVDPEPGSKLNPFTTLLKNFNEDDFVVVKLGELPLNSWQKCDIG